MSAPGALGCWRRHRRQCTLEGRRKEGRCPMRRIDRAGPMSRCGRPWSRLSVTGPPHPFGNGQGREVGAVHGVAGELELWIWRALDQHKATRAGEHCGDREIELFHRILADRVDWREQEDAGRAFLRPKPENSGQLRSRRGPVLSKWDMRLSERRFPTRGEVERRAAAIMEAWSWTYRSTKFGRSWGASIRSDLVTSTVTGPTP